jgi:glycosyltransferase involved in cell wall biosynthesis
MSVRPIAYNLVRLALAAMQTTPRGIDRIELGALTHLFETWPGECVGVLPTALGLRFFSRERVLRGRAFLLDAWREEATPAQDPAWDLLKQRFHNPALPAPPARPRRLVPDIAGLTRLFRMISEGGIAFGQPIRALPRNSLYLDIGHFGLTVPMGFIWRRHRPDVSAVFMLHDAIPLEHPALVAPQTVRAHRKVMAISAREAQMILSPTVAAGEAIRRFLAREGRHDIPVHGVPLPVDPLFSHEVEPEPALAERPYFVVCGAIEPRKNHGFLIEIWHALAERLGPDAPVLIIAGSPGFASGEILARIPRPGPGKPTILCVSGLGSPALARLMAGARALLMPSIAEGFGLPPVEAMALGTPAILSDIAAHREAAGTCGLFLPLHDRQAWLDAILRLASDESALAEARRRVAPFRPISWSAYMAALGARLQAVPLRG